MHVYCVRADGKEAVTVGMFDWLPYGRCLSDFDEDEEFLLSIFRPNEELKRLRFNFYIDKMKEHGPVYYRNGNDLPDGCKRLKGFWENNGWK